MKKNRVVITGLGVVSSVGNDVDTFWKNISEGNSGIDFIKSFENSKCKAAVAAEVKDFNLEDYGFSRMEVKRLDMFTSYALAAAKQVLDDSKINEYTVLDRYRFGTLIGVGIGGLRTLETEIYKAASKGPNRVSPLFIPMVIPNMATGNVAILANAKGYSNAPATACAAGTNAIGDAFKLIQNGTLDVAIAGGAEAGLCEIGVNGFANMTALSFSDDPKRASIPFDKERNGFVISEGAGLVLLEEYEHAKKRGAKIYGEIIGYGTTCDAHHITAPSGEGAVKAIEFAVKDANLKLNEVDYINAHGTSTPLNDKFETMAIKEVFKEYAKNINVSSTKSITGHALGGSGGIEAIATVLAIKNDLCPPTIGYKVQDEECDLNITPNKAVNRVVNIAMSNSLGFGGHNAVIVLKKF